RSAKQSSAVSPSCATPPRRCASWSTVAGWRSRRSRRMKAFLQTLRPAPPPLTPDPDAGARSAADVPVGAARHHPSLEIMLIGGFQPVIEMAEGDGTHVPLAQQRSAPVIQKPRDSADAAGAEHIDDPRRKPAVHRLGERLIGDDVPIFFHVKSDPWGAPSKRTPVSNIRIFTRERSVDFMCHGHLPGFARPSPATS